MPEGKTLEAAVEKIMQRLRSVNLLYIRKIAMQIRKIGELGQASVNRLVAMADMNADIGEITEQLRRITAVNNRTLQKVFLRAMNEQYTDSRFGRYLAKYPLKNTQRQRIEHYVQAVYRQTAGTLANLSNTTAVTMRQAYIGAIDSAILAASTGVASYTETMRDTLRQIGRAGMQVRYASGYRRRLDTAVRQNIVDGINQISKNASVMIGEEINRQAGADVYDAIEISAHARSAPDHEPVQGHVFMKAEWEKLQGGLVSRDIDGRVFAGFRRPIGEWNCRHTPMSFSTKWSKRKWTDEQLRKFIDENRQGCEIDGKHRTLYEAMQMMREIETAVRREKDTAVAAQAAGDDALRQECQRNSNALVRRYAEIAKASGNTEKRQRMTVEGFRAVKVKPEGIITDETSKAVLTNGSESDKIETRSQAFTPARTIEEANEYAKKVLGIPNASYAGADIKVANEWNRGLQEAFTRFPELRKGFGFTGTLSERHNLTWDLSRSFYGEWYRKKYPGWSESKVRKYAQGAAENAYNRYAYKDYSTTYAVSNSTNDPALVGIRGISVNSDVVKDTDAFKARLIANVEEKHSPDGCDTIRSILDHEIGHRLDELVGASKDQVITGLIDSMTNQELTEKLSRYSWDNDNKNKYEEAIAEAWSEYCNNPQCRPVAMAIGKKIEELYDKKYER